MPISKADMSVASSTARARRLVRQFFLGFVRIHILHHANEAAVCGVELSEELRRHGYRLGPGTLYPILHSLESAGYLTRASQIHHGRRRKSYSITPAGRLVLKRARQQIKELIEEVMVGESGR
jgi:DNA-binding PadR family transcriptional regulator